MKLLSMLLLVGVAVLAGTIEHPPVHAKAACCCAHAVAVAPGDEPICPVCGSTACKHQSGCTGDKRTSCNYEKCGCKTLASEKAR